MGNRKNILVNSLSRISSDGTWKDNFELFCLTSTQLVSGRFVELNYNYLYQWIVDKFVCSLIRIWWRISLGISYVKKYCFSDAISSVVGSMCLKCIINRTWSKGIVSESLPLLCSTMPMTKRINHYFEFP
jgi:hypothetical protein